MATSKVTSTTTKTAPNNSGTNTEINWLESTAAGANFFAVQDTVVHAKILLRGTGDTVMIEGFASEYQIKASGKTVTLDNGTQKIVLILNNVSKTNVVADTITFLDGSVSLGNAAGSAAISFGDQKLTKTLTDVVATLNDTNEDSANYFSTADTGGTSASGTTFTLTTGTNKGAAFTGGAGDDSFDAGLSTGSLQTLNSGDNLNGGGGTDELTAVVNGSVTPAGLTDIETVSITAITNAATVDLTNATGMTSLTNQGSTSALTLSGISKTLAVTVQDTSAAVVQVVSYNDVTGTADSATITLKNVTGSAGLTVAGVETLTLDSSGSAANVLATGGLTTANATRLNVTGTQALNVGTLGATISILDASGNTATAGTGVTATMAATSAMTVTGGAGNDSLTLGSGAGADSVTAGAGNDTITFTANYTTADTVDGGAGTDILASTSALLATASATLPTTYTVTNVETINVTDATAGGVAHNAVNISATANRLNLVGPNNADITGGTESVVGAAGAFTVGLGASGAANVSGQLNNASTLTVTDTGTATTDSLTIVNSAINSTTGLNINVYDANNLAIVGYETVTINTGSIAGGAANLIGTITVTADAGATLVETVNFTGANAATAGVITADIVNFSALTLAGTTAAPAVTMVTGSTATKVTGSEGIDILFGATATASSITGGGGNDTITGGSSNDTIDGGAGNDTITTGGGATDSIAGGAGDDTIVATLTTGNTMKGGTGTDKLSLAIAATAATATGVSEFETLVLTGGGITQDMAVFLDNSTFTKIDVGQAGAAGTFTNVGSGVTELTVSVTGNTGTASRLVDTTTNSLTVSLLTGSTTTALTLSDEETINLSSTSTGTVILSTLTDTDLHTLNITGAGAVTITTLAANSTTAGTTLTINASTNTAGVSVSAVNSTIVANITGSSGSNILVGSAGSDTIVGGGQADSITGGVGFDTMTGGSGADTFIFATTSTGTPSSTAFDTITDFTSNSDIIDHGTALTFASTVAAATSGTAALTATGVATFNIADSTLALRIVAVETALSAAATTAGDVAVFQFGADAYVFISDGTGGVTATDNMVKLTGVVLTDAAFDVPTLTAGNLTLV